jgi:hypothetical protein
VDVRPRSKGARRFLIDAATFITQTDLEVDLVKCNPSLDDRSIFLDSGVTAKLYASQSAKHRCNLRISRRKALAVGGGALLSAKSAMAGDIRSGAKSVRWAMQGPGLIVWECAGHQSLSNVLPSSRLATIYAGGFRCLRIPFDLALFCDAPNDETLTSLITSYLAWLTATTAAGMQAIACAHPHGGWDNLSIFDGGTKLARVTYIFAALARAMESIGRQDKIAFEYFNEPGSPSLMPNTDYQKQIMSITASVRPLAPKTTLIIPGANGEAMGTASGLTGACFTDDNMLMAFHWYPGCFTQQNVGTWYRDCYRIPFPPVAGDWDLTGLAKVRGTLNNNGLSNSQKLTNVLAVSTYGTLAQFIRNVNNDIGNSTDQKISQYQYFLNGYNVDGLDTYYSTPQDAAWMVNGAGLSVYRLASCVGMESIGSCLRMARRRLADEQCLRVQKDFEHAQGIVGRSICTEWGMTGDQAPPNGTTDHLGADLTSRVNGLNAMSRALNTESFFWVLQQLGYFGGGQSMWAGDYPSVTRFNSTLLSALQFPS